MRFKYTYIRTVSDSFGGVSILYIPTSGTEISIDKLRQSRQLLLQLKVRFIHIIKYIQYMGVHIIYIILDNGNASQKIRSTMQTQFVHYLSDIVTHMATVARKCI